jgi:hypothetical protein
LLAYGSPTYKGLQVAQAQYETNEFTCIGSEVVANSQDIVVRGRASRWSTAAFVQALLVTLMIIRQNRDDEIQMFCSGSGAPSGGISSAYDSSSSVRRAATSARRKGCDVSSTSAPALPATAAHVESTSEASFTATPRAFNGHGRRRLRVDHDLGECAIVHGDTETNVVPYSS